MRTAVLGAGSFGTALAVHLARLQHPVRLWARDSALAAEMMQRSANATYLPDIAFPPGIEATASLQRALEDAELIICVMPSHGVRAVMSSAAPLLPRGAIVVSATKGLEAESLLRMSELLDLVLHRAHPVVVLSGPSFAAEFARQMPTAVCVASSDLDAAARVQAELRSTLPAPLRER